MLWRTSGAVRSTVKVSTAQVQLTRIDILYFTYIINYKLKYRNGCVKMSYKTEEHVSPLQDLLRFSSCTEVGLFSGCSLEITCYLLPVPWDFLQLELF